MKLCKVNKGFNSQEGYWVRSYLVWPSKSAREPVLVIISEYLDFILRDTIQTDFLMK